MIILHVRPFLSLWIRIQSGSGSETLPVLVTFLSLVSFWTRKHRQFPERTCPERHSPERDNHDRLNISNTKQSRMQLNPERHNPERHSPEQDNHDRLNISNAKQSQMQLNPEGHSPERQCLEGSIIPKNIPVSHQLVNFGEKCGKRSSTK